MRAINTKQILEIIWNLKNLGLKVLLLRFCKTRLCPQWAKYSTNQFWSVQYKLTLKKPRQYSVATDVKQPVSLEPSFLVP